LRKKTTLVIMTVALVLAPLVQLENSAVGQTTSVITTSGSFFAGLDESDGVSNYTIRYNYPPRINIGSNLVVTATLEINAMSGLKLYLRHYRFDAFVFVNGNLVSGATNASDPFASPLYAGSHWGPRELVMPINSTIMGTKPAEIILGNVTLSFLGDVYHDLPKSSFGSESGRSTIGTVSIIDPRGQPSITFEEVALATVVILVVVTGYLISKRRGSKK